MVYAVAYLVEVGSIPDEVTEFFILIAVRPHCGPVSTQPLTGISTRAVT